ncbi:hypothetical protein [Desulfonatronovibrio magnus]|uniref:hypothetical protein n=1 Tax=Desulfonatronovibrio magnus TaxID=698827 RepID=UPI0005EBA0BE|nr:hypothetical protein [Desulfonatronovibrio magnus]
MPKITIILIVVGVLGLAGAAGWFVYQSGSQKQHEDSDRVEETRRIDFAARMEARQAEEEQQQPEVIDVVLEDLIEDHQDQEETPLEEFIGQQAVNSLAEIIFASYLPGAGGQSQLLLSLNQVNMHFATDLSDFEVTEEDLPVARQQVFAKLLQPGVISALSAYFGPRLLDRVEELTKNKTKIITVEQDVEERKLRRTESADLFRLLAQRLSYLSRVFENSVHDPTIIYTRDYLRKVNELQQAYFEYWQMEDDAGNEERDRLGRKINSLIAEREEIRENIVSAVASTDMREAGYDYVYEVQWVYRRIEVDGYSRESMLALAEAGRMLSAMSLDRAEEVLAGN